MELITFTVLLLLDVRLIIPDSWHLYSIFLPWKSHSSNYWFLHLPTDILYDSWSPAMTVSSICISILSMLSSSPAKVAYFLYISLLNWWILLSDCNTCTDCSNAQPIMIAMSGTVAMGGHRRRPGGGSMMTLCDWCSDCCCPVRI